MNLRKRLGLGLSVLAAVLVLLVGVCYLNHELQLKREEAICTPMGRQIAINGHTMHLYTEGQGEHAIIFLSGGGTCSPVLDFKSLYSLLSEDDLIVVVEKAGYGFSEDADIERDVASMLEETREVLYQAGFRPPYVLCAHSMSGIEALYWAQEYPDEVSAIVGLDMAVPAAYEEMEINIPLMKLGSFANKLGVARWIPGLAEGDAVKGGTLTEEEKELYRALFYRCTLSKAMIREAETIKESAALVAQGEKVTAPILMFASDGSGGTGYDKETWRRFQTDFAAAHPDARVIELDCPHYVHDYAYAEIAEQMADFFTELAEKNQEG